VRSVLVFALLGLWAIAFAASVETKDGARFQGTVVAISERGVVIRTAEGERVVPPEEVVTLELDRPWALGFANGEKKTGRLAVRSGTWSLDGEPFNFYSVFAFAPVQETAPAASEEAPRPPAKAATGARALGPRAPLRLPQGQVEFAGQRLDGEVLLVTPSYLLLLLPKGELVKIPLARIEAFSSDIPWTAVDLEGRGLTGALQAEGGRWTIGDLPLDLDRTVAFVPRLDLARKGEEQAAAPAHTDRGSASGEKSPEKKQKASSDGRKDTCPDPGVLQAPSRVNVAGWAPEVAIKTAGDFAQSGDWVEAIRIYSQIVADAPDQTSAWMRLGSAYRQLALRCQAQGRDERSQAYFDRAEKAYAEAQRRATSPREQKIAAYWRSRLEDERRWGPVAVEAFEKGYDAFQKNDFEAAAAAFEKASQASPGWPDAAYWRGRALLQMGKREAAIRALNEALVANPNFNAARDLLLKLGIVAEGTPLQSLLAEAYRRETEGDLEGARRIYTAAAERFPDAFPVVYRLGLLDRKLGLWEEAKVMLSKALELADQDDARTVRYWLGRLDRDARYGIQAVDFFEKGYAAYARGDYEEAAARFAKAAELAPEWADAYYWQARSKLKLGQRAEALALLQKTLAIDPGHEGAKTLFRKLGR